MNRNIPQLWEPLHTCCGEGSLKIRRSRQHDLRRRTEVKFPQNCAPEDSKDDGGALWQYPRRDRALVTKPYLRHSTEVYFRQLKTNLVLTALGRRIREWCRISDSSKEHRRRAPCKTIDSIAGQKSIPGKRIPVSDDVVHYDVDELPLQVR